MTLGRVKAFLRLELEGTFLYPRLGAMTARIDRMFFALMQQSGCSLPHIQYDISVMFVHVQV